MRFAYLFVMVFTLPLFAAEASAVNGGKVTEYKLDNGMQVIVKEDNRAPMLYRRYGTRLDRAMSRMALPAYPISLST